MHSCVSRPRAQLIRAGGFSLVEVVIAIGIVAFAVLSMIGLFGFFGQSTSGPVNREEAARAFNSIALYLNGKSLDAGTSPGTPLGGSAGAYFNTVLQWIQQGAPTFIYAYKPVNATNSGGYQISQTTPSKGSWDGTLLVAEVKALYTDTNGTQFLPPAVMTSGTYTKSYIPVEVAIYARPGGAAVSSSNSLPAGALIDTYPAVITR